MTNADKILKDDISIEEVASEFESFCEMLKENYIVLTYKQEMEQFLNCEIEPTLTEDESFALEASCFTIIFISSVVAPAAVEVILTALPLVTRDVIALKNADDAKLFFALAPNAVLKYLLEKLLICVITSL